MDKGKGPYYGWGYGNGAKCVRNNRRFIATRIQDEIYKFAAKMLEILLRGNHSTICDEIRWKEGFLDAIVDLSKEFMK